MNLAKPVNETSVSPIKAVQNIYTAEKLINGECGYALQAIALQALNFTTSSLITSHSKLKMPVPVKDGDTPDSLRELMETNPEFERAPEIKLDVFVNANVATCALIRDLAEHQEINEGGTLVRPYSWIADRARTPISSVTQQYDWRADQSAKLAGEQARLMKMTPEQIKMVTDKAVARTNADNRERLAYALAEINSVVKPSLLKEESNKLVDMLLDLDKVAFDIVKLVKASAERDVTRSQARLLDGKFTRIDEEVLLFANM